MRRRTSGAAIFALLAAVTVVVADETGETDAAPAGETETTQTQDANTYEGQAFPEEPTSSGAVLPDLVIQGENKVLQDVLKSAPVERLTAAEIDSVHTSIDDLVLEVSPVSGIRPHLNNLVDLQSTQTPHYWLPDMAKPPIVTFHTDDMPRAEIANWDLKVVNFRGLTIRHFEGRGAPLRRMPWDGRDEQGEMIRVGYPYSYVLAVTDRGTNTYNYGGSSFRITAMDYRDDDSRLLEMAGGRLFSKGGKRLLSEGEDLLDKATDAVREHPLSALTVTVVAPDREVGAARAEVVAQYLAESLIIPAEEIKQVVFEDPQAAVEMDGSIQVEIHSAR